jgi:phthalate 4,5-cis-dihydrodiol dehydrogenase
MNLRIGLVGLGTGGRSLPQAIAKTTGFTFVAGADLREEARAQYAADFGIQTFDSVEAMCGLKDLNAVYVATPNPFHAGHAIAALQAGKHVMVEKPMALTLADCDRMIAAAERNRVKLMVAHTRSWNAPIRKMREIISSGRLGRVTQVHTLRYSPWLLRPREPVEIDTALGGGVCYRQAPHQVDIARLLGGGLVESVRAHAGRWSPENDTEGNYSALLQFAGGVTATLIYDGYGYFDDRELIEGDVFGSGRQSSPGQRLRQARAAGKLDKNTSRSGAAFDIERGDGGARRRPLQPFFGITLVSCERGVLRQSSEGVFLYDEQGRSEVPCQRWDGPLKVELDEFHRSITESRPMPHDGKWGKATLEVCLAMLQSSRDQSEVRLCHQVGSPY